MRTPSFLAADNPLFSGKCMTCIRSSPAAQISQILPPRSVDASSTTIISRFGYVCSVIDFRHRSTYGSTLYTGTITLMIGFPCSISPLPNIPAFQPLHAGIYGGDSPKSSRADIQYQHGRLLLLRKQQQSLPAKIPANIFLDSSQV